MSNFNDAIAKNMPGWKAGLTDADVGKALVVRRVLIEGDTVLPETIINGSSYSGVPDGFDASLLTIGTTYVVQLDGEAYEATMADSGGSPSYTNDDPEFSIALSSGSLVISFPSAGAHTLKISVFAGYDYALEPATVSADSGSGGGSGGDDVFVVKMTSPEDYVFQLDKTCQEIAEAYLAGKTVVIDSSALAYVDSENNIYDYIPAYLERIQYEESNDPPGAVLVRFYNFWMGSNQLNTYQFHQSNSYPLPTWQG